MIFLFLAVTVMASKSYWPQLFSKQDKINPKAIKDEYNEKARVAVFNNNEIKIPTDLIKPEKNLKILGENSGSKRIEIDLTTQQLHTFEGDRLIHTFFISSGLWNRTPTGTFKVWIKVRSQKMSGGSKELGTYYYLPNVPYVMFFYNDRVSRQMGYSLHGTYWHNNFGHPMSHGCINMKTSDIAQIYPWVDINTPVIIYGKYQYKN